MSIELLPGDIILVHGTDFVSTGVEVVTKSPFSHVAMVSDPYQQMLVEANALRTVGYEPMSKYVGHGLAVRVTDATDSQRQGALDYIYRHFGCRYDYVGIAQEFERYEFGANVHDDGERTFICSTLIYHAYLAVGIRLTDVPLPSPDDIYKSPRVTILGRF